MAYKTDYQVSADQSVTMLRVWSHHWGCQVNCRISNRMHSIQLESRAASGEVKGRLHSTKTMQPQCSVGGSKRDICLLLV